MPDQAHTTDPAAEEQAAKEQAAKKQVATDTPTDGESAGEGKKKKPSLSAVWRESREILWTYRHRLVLGLVLLLISRAASMVLPASTKWLIDEVIGKHRIDLLWWIAGAAGAATVISAATSFGLSMLLGVAAQRSINDMRIRLLQHVSRLPIRFFEDRKVGILIARVMNDAEGLRNLVGTGFVQLVGGLFTATTAMGVLIYLNWRLTAITMVFVVLFVGVIGMGFKRLRPIFRQRNQLNAEVTGHLAEMLGGIRVVKAYTAEKRESRAFAHNAHKLLRNVVQSMVGVSSVTSLSSLLFGLVGLGMSVVGAREVLAGRMTLGDIFAYVMFTGLLVAPLIQISSIGTQITEAFAGLDRVREIFAETTEDEEDKTRQPLARLRGDVTFEGVWFEYKTGLPVLRGIDFKAPAGTTTALVGPSGAGKSTVISLVMAFNRPQKGRILVDGHDLAEVRLRDYRSQLGIVLQDNFLFDGTVRENIGYSRPGATLDEIREAARIAHCDEFIAGFPDGYESIIGERGVKVSGGQRQRLAIARAILADPRVLILDEATSSLDSESEQKIQDGLHALLRGRTTFVIAHRLSTIVRADQILVLDEGQIVEHGTHTELLALGGRYKALYDTQYRIETDRYINPGEDFTPEPERPKLPAGAPSSPRRL